jgi:dGTPase
MLASFASNPDKSKGRLHKEGEELLIRSPFELDRARIIESTAFRRLEYKTQVFVNHEGDHYRNRLTHSLEAAEIARIISKALKISSDLAESLTLAHDLGHAPFGHAGEDALSEVMQERGANFSHNLHTLTLVTELENRHPQFEGLNLTWETIDGIIKHNGPILEKDLCPTLMSYAKTYNLELDKYSCLEAQISSLADDIAYNNHDIDDGFRAGLIAIDELKNIGIFGEILQKVQKEFPRSENHILLHEAILRMKNIMIMDLIENTQKNIQKFSIETNKDVRNLGKPLAYFSERIEEYHKQIKSFLMEKVYTHYTVKRMANRGRRIIKELFYLYMEDFSCLPNELRLKLSTNDQKHSATVIGNYIACMSDRYAIAEYQSFFDVSSSYINKSY